MDLLLAVGWGILLYVEAVVVGIGLLAYSAIWYGLGLGIFGFGLYFLVVGVPYAWRQLSGRTRAPNHPHQANADDLRSLVDTYGITAVREELDRIEREQRDRKVGGTR
jgi:hypothetical protein